MLEALKTAGLPRFAHQAIRRYSWSWLAILVAALAISLTGFAAHAADDDDDDSDARNYYVFQSVIMIGPGKWCIDIPASEYQPDKPLALSECTGKANQTFGFANGSNLTAGGLCLDGLSGPSGKSPTVGAPVVIAQCDGSDHQVWELQSFTDKEKVFAIANSDGLCVTADGEEIQRGTPLVLAQCAEQPNQGWLSGDVDPEAFASGGGGGGGEVVLYGGGYTEPEYYWYSGQRYCWYDLGWHGPGWYWCGQNLVRGIGWGGPIGWHFWHHRGHRVLVHRVFFKDHPGHPGHAHAPFLRKAGGGGKATTRTGTTRTDTTRTGTMGGTTTRTVTKRTVTMGGSSKTRTVTMGGGTKTRTVTMGGSTTRTGTMRTGPVRTGPVRTGPVHTGPTGSTGGVGRGGSRPGGGRVIMSDIRAKHDIALLGRLENGLGFYRFRYNGSDQAYVGVMAQEVAAFLPEAVLRGRDGYLRVRYDMLGLRLQTWKDWVGGGAQVPH